MKKLFYYTIALLATVSCAKEIAPQDNVEAPKGELKTFTIGASIDNSTIAPSQVMSKANLDADLNVLWQEKDTIGLVTADGTITPAVIDPAYAGKSEGVFTYESENELDVAYAYYPYTSTSKVCNQSVTDGKLSITLKNAQNVVNTGLIEKNTLIMAAKADGASVVFKNTCSIAKISVKGLPCTSKKLYVQTPERAINGAGTVDLTADRPVFVADAIDELALETNESRARYTILHIDARDNNTITPGKEEPVLAGYVVLPEGTYHSLTFETLGQYGEATSYIQSYSPVKDIVMNAGKIRPLNVPIDIPESYTDLSAGGKYANCYMIQNETSEYFGFGLYTRAYSGGVATNKAIGLNDAYNASVLWQSTEGLISSVTYNKANKMIYFKRDAGKTGNAVIALRARDGKVHYSWHIWVVGEEVGTNTFANRTVLMDRNLGAYSSDSDYTMIGTFYQGGRKDPFPAASQAGDRDHATVYPDVIKTLVAQDGKSSDWAACHPNVYIWGDENTGKQDWLDTQDNNRWVAPNDDGTVLKRPHDPCPYGYRVPKNTDFNSKGAGFQTILDAATQNGIFLTLNDSNDVPASFPMGGTGRAKTSTSEYVNVGTQGWIWCGNGTTLPASVGTGTGLYKLHFMFGDAGFGDAVPRRRAANVRCIKFTEVNAE